MAVIEGAEDLFEIVNDPKIIIEAIKSKNGIFAYMASWCGPCIRSVDRLVLEASLNDRLLEELSYRNLRLLYVDADNGELIAASPHGRYLKNIPTFFGHVGNKLKAHQGPLNTDEFIELLERWYGPKSQS